MDGYGLGGVGEGDSLGSECGMIANEYGVSLGVIKVFQNSW